MVIPTAPVPNAVNFKDRVAIRVNRAGTELMNPVAGTNRTTYGATGGFNVRVSWTLLDESETIRSAQFTSYDEDDAVVDSSNIIAKVTRDTANYTAYANLIAGIDIPSSAAGLRNELVVQTNLGRTITQQIYVRNAPVDIVTFNGVTTTNSSPLQVELEQIDGVTPYRWGVQFFPTWNDEVGRQHGAGVTALQGQIAKPYGGAATVEAWKFGAILTYSERPVEELSTMEHTPTAAGETVWYEYRFRSKAGSASYVVGYGYIRFFECEETPASSATSICPEDNPPWIEFPPDVPPPSIPPDENTTTFDPSTPSVDVRVGGLGRTGADTNSHAAGTIIVQGFIGGQHATAGSSVPTIDYLGTKTVAIDSGDVGTDITIDIDGDIAGADLVIVTINSESAGTDDLNGNSLIYVSEDAAEMDTPSAPTVINVDFEFDAHELSFNVTDYGWPSTNMTAHVVPLYSIVSSSPGQPQTIGSLGIDTTTTALTQSVLYSSGTGSKDLAFTLSPDPQAVVVWFSNAFGQTAPILIDEGAIDSGVMKKGPAIAAGLLGTTTDTRDTVQFNVTDDGYATGSMRYFYIIVDSNLDQVQFTDDSPSGSITTGVGPKSFIVETGHHDIDGHYYIGLYNGQGGIRGNLLHIDNTTFGARTLSG